jgi:hypothetical protein
MQLDLKTAHRLLKLKMINKACKLQAFLAKGLLKMELKNLNNLLYIKWIDLTLDFTLIYA